MLKLSSTPCAIKNVPLYFCLYLCQLLIDFRNSFTSTLCGQFTIMWLLYIPPHSKCILHYLVKYKCRQKLTIITKTFVPGKWKNASDQHCDEWFICVIPSQSSIIQTIHCNVELLCFFFNFTKMFVMIVMYAYFIDISQGSVEKHWCIYGVVGSVITTL